MEASQRKSYNGHVLYCSLRLCPFCWEDPLSAWTLFFFFFQFSPLRDRSHLNIILESPLSDGELGHDALSVSAVLLGLLWSTCIFSCWGCENWCPTYQVWAPRNLMFYPHRLFLSCSTLGTIISVPHLMGSSLRFLKFSKDISRGYRKRFFHWEYLKIFFIKCEILETA